MIMKLFKKLFKKKTYGQSNHKLLIIDDNGISESDNSEDSAKTKRKKN